MKGPLYLLYQLVFNAAGIPLLLLWPLYSLINPRAKVKWRERLGFWGEVPKGAILLHGASLGEVRAIKPLAEKVAASGTPIIVTSTSDTGRDEALRISERFGEGGAARLLPLDFFWCIGRMLSSARPSAIVIGETELWPGLLVEAARREIPTYIVSGRLSDSAFKAYRRFAPLFRAFLPLVKNIQCQTRRDMERFVKLGAPIAHTSVNGNLKFDIQPATELSPGGALLRRLGEAGFKVIVAGSTRPTEERVVTDAVNLISARVDKTALFIAPRHLERLGEAIRDVESAGREVVLWSETSKDYSALKDAAAAGHVVIVDEMFILSGLYSGAKLAFVGGSIPPIGGHSLLEPLLEGVPVLFGPHMESQRVMRDEAISRGLGWEIDDADGLAIKAIALLSDEEELERVRRSARELFDENSGALDGALTLLKSEGHLEARR
ncbi:MAG: hypothetical protein C0609_10020 [Deltaproteobacteria bacterium]|nr:MAG: hypothetical protein C0609_10020 [Deltaproteobacteria bacterium]